MKLPPLTVIEASAGTGKTFALVTRLLTLIFHGAEPERVVALTFSRFAAGEIFNSFIERLAKAAQNEAVAAEESERLGLTLTSADFAAKLRLVISRQHLSLIGTLDSFLMRIVRLIPYELGLEGEVSVMSDYQSPVERLRLVGDLMRLESEDAKAVFREAFALVFGSVGAKGFVSTFSDFIEAWHTRVRDLPEVSAWGDKRTIWGDDPPADLDVSVAEIRALAERLAPYTGKRGADTFIAAVAEFAGTLPKTIPVCLKEDPVAIKAIKLMSVWKIARAVKSTVGIYRLMRAYEASYNEKIRRRGLVTFDDLPRLLKKLEPAVRLALEYRMDAKFDHWALDEFQDTSRDQWRAIANLIDEGTQSAEGRSVFIVGDRKQSIYDWRGGDVRILGEEVELARAKGNELIPLDESYRYVGEITEAVNRLFDETAIRGAFGANWICRTHESHDKSTRGFVEVIQAEKSSSKASIADFFDPIENALNAVRPWERGISTAILVRKNKYGEAIVSELKARGLADVVFEGDGKVADTPILAAMVALVKLAEHAADKFAYAEIACSPLAAALYPNGLPKPQELSAALLKDFTRLGLVRKFREVREAIKGIDLSWNKFAESRFEDFIKCVAEFEEKRDPSMSLSSLNDFLVSRKRRDFAEPGQVRVMTMHQSKGLGFDWVIVPFFEPDAIASPKHLSPLTGETPPWILEHPSPQVADSDETLAAAEERRVKEQCYDALCLDYVALTRAKRALTIILNPLNKTAPKKPERFSDLVRELKLETFGDMEWYRSFAKTEPTDSSEKQVEERFVRSPREKVEKRRPSEHYLSGLSGASLFADNFGAAARRGSEKHAELAKIEWGEGVFAKPSEDAELWRERAYEIFADGTWESGQFDRVVFTGSGENRRAIIYDFKTGANHDEARYAPQMSAYRRALSRLTGIPEARIETKLVWI